jgi:DNA adenine methylase
MQYFGGKFRIAKKLAEIINSNLTGLAPIYYEPFCGALNVTQYINPKALRVASDFNKDLIVLLRAVQSGWVPPEFVSEDEYRILRLQAEVTPLKAFAGFACSFGACYFGGYARDYRRGGVNFAEVGGRRLLKKFEALKGVTFWHQNFMDLSPLPGAVIYCDPPYANTRGYKTGAFNSAAFWEKVRSLSATNLVIISEYVAPPDFMELAAFETDLNMRNAKGERAKRVEKLFTYF